MFRVQFHTCTIHGARLSFPKDQLDEAWAGKSEANEVGREGKASGAWLLTSTTSTDERFPFQASVEFVFSSSPEKVKGKSGSWRSEVLKVLGGGAPLFLNVAMGFHRQHPTERSLCLCRLQHDGACCTLGLL